MSIDKSVLEAKLQELHGLLREAGLNSNIEVRTSDADGNPDVSMTLDGGYWKNSTAYCEPSFYSSHETIFPESEPLTNWSSSANC